MVKATESDRNLVVNILADSFKDNLSVQYILKKGKDNSKSVKALMEYSFDVCMLFGEVFLSEDRRACALIMFSRPEKRYFKIYLSEYQTNHQLYGNQQCEKSIEPRKVDKGKAPNS